MHPTNEGSIPPGLPARPQPLKVLIVEDYLPDAEMVLRELRRSEFVVEWHRADTEVEYLARLHRGLDLVLADYAMPQFSGLRALELLKQRGLDVPFIIVSGVIGEETAVAAMKAGAADYLLKDRLARLGPAINRVLEESRLRRERQQAGEALRLERTLLRTVLDLLPDSIYVKDGQSRFLACNDRCARGMGAASPQEVIGRTDADYFPAELAAEFRAEELAVLAGTPLVDKEESYVGPDGQTHYHLTTKLPRRDRHGKIIGLVGTGRDITGRRQLEEQLRQSQKMEAIGQLSGGVAHDFNNLLSVIKGNIGLLHSKGRVVPEIAESIRQIEGAADRAAKLTRQLLTFSRQQVMQPTELNLNGLVLNLTKMLRRLLSESITLEIECAAQPLPIRADEGMVEQVLLNLMVNARDAMPKTGTLRVTTAAVDLDEPAARRMVHARPGEFACLTVRDTGTGIAPEVIQRIFEPFFTTKRAGKGTGLGLTTVYSVMQQHDGWVNVESEVGRGTTFRVYFPRLTSELPAAQSKQTSARVLGGHEEILLVEDELAVREIAEVVLTSLGYRVFSAVSGLAALQVWEERKHEIELLLTDLIMPDGVTGRDLALRLRGDNPHLPIIYMSGYGHDVAGEGFPLLEGSNYLPKPFDLTSLAKIVRTSLDRGATRQPFARPPT